MKKPFRLLHLLIVTLVAVAAQGAAQAPKSPTPGPVPAEASASTLSAPSSSVSSRGAELFSMPAIPDEDRAGAPAPLTQAESEMQAMIQSAIGKDPTLSGGNVNVAMSADGIELSGSVATNRARLAASRLAKSYAGGRKVVDKITISVRPNDTTAEPTPGKANSSGDHLHP